MTTRERFVEQLRGALTALATSDDEDDDLVGILQLARGFGLGPGQIADTFSKIVPSDDAAADAWIEQLVGFVLSLRTPAAIAARPGAEFPASDIVAALLGTGETTDAEDEHGCPPFRYHDRDPDTGVCSNCGQVVPAL